MDSEFKMKDLIIGGGHGMCLMDLGLYLLEIARVAMISLASLLIMAIIRPVI